MTVKEMFEAKYKEHMATINRRAWENAKFYAEHKGMPVYEYIMLSIEITQGDLRRWNASYYGELEELHKAKCIASNRHRQEHGHIDRYWLTEKGYKQLGL
jgi:hypothetical protein